MTRTIAAESSAVEVPNPTGPADDVEKSADDLAPPIPPWYTSVVLRAWAIGIMLLAGFGLIGFTDLNAMNGLKNVISAILSLVSVATYMVAGLIHWTYALPVAIACTVGGYVGAALARRITRPQMLRIFITLVGAVMTVAFFLV